MYSDLSSRTPAHLTTTLFAHTHTHCPATGAPNFEAGHSRGMVSALQAVAAHFAAQHHQHRLPVRDDIAAAVLQHDGLHIGRTFEGQARWSVV